jgi:hypothetical protein
MAQMCGWMQVAGLLQPLSIWKKSQERALLDISRLFALFWLYATLFCVRGLFSVAGVAAVLPWGVSWFARGHVTSP